jgi:galactokinase
VTRCAYAPGRVNLIGDHTDYSGGLVMPMAIDLGTSVEFDAEPDSAMVHLVSTDDRAAAIIPVGDPLSAPTPDWSRYLAGVLSVLRPAAGGRGRVSTTLPIGAGLSSSAALEVAFALALGFADDTLALAQACQQAEQAAVGVPCGIMDQLASAAGVAGHALLIDCTSLAVVPVALPPTVEVVAVHSGEARRLAVSAYAERRGEVEAAARALGRPLRGARPSEVEALADPLLRRRARHVVTENERVDAFADALRSGDAVAAGALMDESHRSLAADFGVSTPALDGLAGELRRADGVFGVRLTGAGFGGCVVALVAAGRAAGVARSFARAWVLRPSGGATSYMRSSS